MMRRYHVPLLCFLALGPLACWSLADPLTSFDYVGTNKAIKVTSSGAGAYPNTVSVNGSNLVGGGFRAEFSMTGATPYTAATTVWCVDSQLSFSSGDQYQANVTLLTPASWNPSEVRYGFVNGFGGAPSNFVYDVGLGANDDAFNRFRMAAFLVSQYAGFPSGPAGSGAADQKNDAIQRAIWNIMYNNHPGAKFSWDLSSVNISSGVVGYTDWIAAALAFVTNSANNAFFSNWAVVTWDVNADGSLSNLSKQTFLVQVVPEPGFYGLLALALAGLFLAMRRRKVSAT